MEKMKLSNLSMDELRALADRELCDKYLPVQGEWETMASQLITATAKLVYKYYNDGDRYDEASCNDMSTYANWIDNHCFRLLKWNEDYEEKLRHILIYTLLICEELADTKAVWSIYKEEWYFHDLSDDEDCWYEDDDEY